MDLCLPELEKELSAEIIGRKIYYFTEIGSTNDEAFMLGKEGAPEGTVVLADSQVKGKGRLERIWHSPPQVNIYTSIILRPDCLHVDASRITIMGGLAVAEIIENICPGETRIKWPNDVLLSGKKVCGILAQMQSHGDKIDFVVVGIGINVNMNVEELPLEIKSVATSIFVQTGELFSRQDILISLYKNISKWYKTFLAGGFDMIKEKWLTMAALIGGDVCVRFRNEVINGKAVGIDQQGALILSRPGGEIVKILAGDASILKEN